MDKLAQIVASFLASAWVIIPYSIWVIYHTISSPQYVSAISDITFLAALLILRDEQIAAKKHEEQIKKDVRFTKKVLKLLQNGRKK